MAQFSGEDRLADDLFWIERFENLGSYDKRNEGILRAMLTAQLMGLKCGFGIDRNHDDDPDFDGFRVVAYIELPTGQVSWHLPEHSQPWDEHTTAEKYDRCRKYREAAPMQVRWES